MAANQGYAAGQTNLGFMYEQGWEGLAKSDADTVKWCRLAADQGLAAGQAYLGIMYECGIGDVRQDRFEAVRLHRLAAKQNNDFAMNALRRLGEKD